MVRKALLISFGALVIALGLLVVASLTKRRFPTPVSDVLLSLATPAPVPPLIASGQVLGVKKEMNALTVQFDSPPMFRGKTQDVEIACPASESFVNTMTLNIKAKKPMVVSEPQPTNKLLFQIADPTKKDTITGTCASPSCTTLERGCILTRTVYLR
ncbi:MAG: hypothetical protein UW69_C0098G0003 [Microgenomates group bacterium GW2011_GWA2_44_7]|nr:MAG: hypothetical protein UW69_C0098G0003 [Microgenomates group bacterium GW2011_GWA2_44_7]